ncbi:TetR/AcrR family transcriptional regulator [Clostridium pasteurianum]|uniref:Transcriptional regulator n=1 Tax=Clostridium pasteurianum BC1 TaxID=86416 RepID=R4K846_CLOPA|nr:TetR/AcrR family transcriptional regulator [Clostridium pasteurianum]AGK95815.1 transcriptional regulator [Clostridium pasteurianum BC1]
MNGFEKRREDKKESILDAALELFKEFGYDKVSIAEIAKKASVSQVSIYNFFDSKKNLRDELLKKLVNANLVETLDILESSDSVKVKIEKLLMSKINFCKSFSMHFLVESVHNNSSESAPGYFAIEYIGKDNYKKIEDGFTKLFEQGKKEGLIDKDISIESILYYTDAIRYYFLNNPSSFDKLENNPKLAKEFFSLMYYGIMKR